MAGRIFWLPRWLSGKESAYNPGDPGLRSLGRGDPLEKEMATHSSILAWQVPWTEKPGGLAVHGGDKSQEMTERLNSSVGSWVEAQLLFVACGI